MIFDSSHNWRFFFPKTRLLLEFDAKSHPIALTSRKTFVYFDATYVRAGFSSPGSCFRRTALEGGWKDRLGIRFPQWHAQSLSPRRWRAPRKLPSWPTLNQVVSDCWLSARLFSFDAIFVASTLQTVPIFEEPDSRSGGRVVSLGIRPSPFTTHAQPLDPQR